LLYLFLKQTKVIPSSSFTSPSTYETDPLSGYSFKHPAIKQKQNAVTKPVGGYYGLLSPPTDPSIKKWRKEYTPANVYLKKSLMNYGMPRDFLMLTLIKCLCNSIEYNISAVNNVSGADFEKKLSKQRIE